LLPIQPIATAFAGNHLRRLLQALSERLGRHQHLLVGQMGAGKSAVGRPLADALAIASLTADQF